MFFQTPEEKKEEMKKLTLKLLARIEKENYTAARNAFVASWLLNLCDTNIKSELSMSEQTDLIIKALGECPDRILEYLILASGQKKPLDLDGLEEPHIEGQTDAGVEYGTIARWLLSCQPMHKFVECEDWIHYGLMAKAFAETPEIIMYYLGAAASNNKASD